MQYTRTALKNPFGAPVYHIDETDSTMKDARFLASQGEPDGTVIFADYQMSGRGRVDGRQWNSRKGENLLCTVMLRRPPLPGFTLRVGLAIAQTFDSFLPSGLSTRIKWPNDVLVDGKKVSGILCENDGRVIYVGTGLNINQTVFPDMLAGKATSLALVSGPVQKVANVGEILERYLERLSHVMGDDDWQKAVDDKLYQRGELVSFRSGDPGKNESIDGYIESIGPSGELLLRPQAAGSGIASGTDSVLRLFSGELPYPGN